MPLLQSVNPDIRDKVFGQIIEGVPKKMRPADEHALRDPLWDRLSEEIYVSVIAGIRLHLLPIPVLDVAGEFWVYFNRNGPRISSKGFL